MKKWTVIILAALLALVISAAALENEPAAELIEKAQELLLHTDNVTLNVNAEFSLDGVWFKTAEGTWKQDGDRSFRELVLKAPKADGSERRNGYTIVTDAERLYLMEAFTPGVYRNGFTAGRRSILRNTVELNAMFGLAKALASQAGSDLVLGSGAITRTAEGDILIKLDDRVPELANAALNQFAWFAAKRYFNMDYDRMRADGSLSLYNYATVTEGLLYAMQSVSFRNAEITVKTDAEGRLQHAEGSIGLYVNTAADGPKQLDVSFRADVTDLGSTRVRKFDPADYNVVQAQDEAMIGADAGEEIGGELPAENGALIDEISLRAMEIWAETGYDMTDIVSVGCRMEGNRYVVSLEGQNPGAKKAFFTLDGQFTGIQAEPNDWQNEDSAAYAFDPEPDAELDRKAKEFLMDFLKKASPEISGSVKDLKVEWIYETGNAAYAQYHEEPLDQENDGVLLVIRLIPQMRVEYYSCVSNG